MIHSIEFIGLFGMYDYLIDFAKSNKKDLLFMTGPNGMGKSTILRLIHALYDRDFHTLCKVPYAQLIFHFDQCDIVLNRHYSVHTEEKSDIPESERVDLYYMYVSKHQKQENPFTEHCHWQLIDNELSRVDEPDSSINSLDLLMESERCLYISDKRIEQNIDEEPLYAPNVLGAFLQHLKNDIVNNLLPIGPVEDYVNKDLENWVKSINRTLSFLSSCGIDFPAQEDALKSDNKDVVWHTCRCLEHAFEECARDIEALRVFTQIVTESSFVDKELVVSIDKGYRFLSHNKERTILLFDMLSSGEQHLICQLMTLLFSRQKIALVLIDEPELSYHLMWQMQYLKQMEKIQKLRDCSCLIATHSTQIFEGRFDIATDLWKQHKLKPHAQK